MASRVTVDAQALVRAWTAAGHTELWFQFEHGDVHDVTGVVGDAVETVNDQLDVAIAENEATGRHAFCEGPWHLPLTPNVYAFYMKRPGTEDGVLAWIDRFATLLEDAGLRGRIRPTPPADDSAWEVVNAIDAPQLATFFAYHLPDPTKPRGWNVDDDTTAEIVHQVELTDFPGAEIYLRAGRMMRTDMRAVTAALPDGLARSAVSGVTCIRRDPARVVSTNFLSNGLVGRAVYDPQQSWPDRLAQCVDAMLATAQLVDVAFIQHVRNVAGSWNGLDTGSPSLPGPGSAWFAQRRPGLEHFVPDARGIQVVTSTHLERAHDLNDWTVEALGNGRHLVQARDLDAWYGPDGPTPDVLAAARADFGPMIARREDLQAWA